MEEGQQLKRVQSMYVCLVCPIEPQPGWGNASVGAGGFFHASFSIKYLWNKINIFSCSSSFFFFFLKKQILSIWFLIESHCLISHVWSDLFLCFFLNEITANSLFIESKHRDPVVESQEITFFENLLKSSDLAYIYQYFMIVSATLF